MIENTNQGFVLVPRELTQAMRIALGLVRFANPNIIWATLLAAAPPVAVEEADARAWERSELIERLREGVQVIGLHEDNTTELYDIEDADAMMSEAAQALSASPVPSPAYGGVKELEWVNIGRCIGWTADNEHTHLYYAKGLDRLYEVARGKVGWWAKWQGGFHAKELPTLAEAKAAAQADFERRVLACIEAAPVTADEGGAVGETYYDKGKDADHFERLNNKDFAWALTCAAQDLNDSSENVSSWMPVTALLDGAAERIKATLTDRAEIDRGTAEAEGAKPTAEFGHGLCVVDTGYHYGQPAVFIGPCPEPGPIGQRVTNPDHKLPLDRLKDGEFFLTFPTDEQAKRVADALVTPSLQISDAGAGPVGEAVAWAYDTRSKARLDGPGGIEPYAYGNWYEELSRSRPAESNQVRNIRPLYASPVEAAGEVAPQPKTYCAMLSTGVCDQIARAETAEARATDLQERLEKVEAAGDPIAAYTRLPGFERLPADHAITQGSRLAARQLTAGDLRQFAAALTGDAQEAGK